MSKEDWIKVLKFLATMISAALVALGVSGCQGYQFECQGQYCVKKVVDL